MGSAHFDRVDCHLKLIHDGVGVSKPSRAGAHGRLRHDRRGGGDVAISARVGGRSYVELGKR